MLEFLSQHWGEIAAFIGLVISFFVGQRRGETVMVRRLSQAPKDAMEQAARARKPTVPATPRRAPSEQDKLDDEGTVFVLLLLWFCVFMTLFITTSCAGFSGTTRKALAQASNAAELAFERQRPVWLERGKALGKQCAIDRAIDCIALREHQAKRRNVVTALGGVHSAVAAGLLAVTKYALEPTPSAKKMALGWVHAAAGAMTRYRKLLAEVDTP